MIAPRIPPNPCTLVRERHGRDRLTGDRTAIEELVVPDVVWAPADTSDTSPRAQVGEQTVTRRVCHIRDVTDIDVVSTDRVRFPGEAVAAWLVSGDVEPWVSPWGDAGGPSGCRFQVERTTG